MWILSIVGISVRGGAVSYGLFAALTLIPFFSLLYLFAVYLLFHIYQKIGRRYVSVNEPIHYHFALVNECPLIFTGIRVRFCSDFSSITALDDEPEYELQPNTRIERETTLICKYRGEYEVGIKDIEIQDHFRLFRITYRNRRCVQAIVRPQLITLESMNRTELSQAVRSSHCSETDPDILSREYASGDDRRFINWAQSARTGTLMTRTRIGTEHNEIAIITDTFRSTDDRTLYIPEENRILELTLAVSYYFDRNNIPFAAYFYQQSLCRAYPEKSTGFDGFYEAVSAAVFDRKNTHGLLYEAVIGRGDIFASSMVFFILSSWDSDAEKLLNILENNELYTVICLVTDKENDLPDMSGHNRSRLITFSPYESLTEVI